MGACRQAGRTPDDLLVGGGRSVEVHQGVGSPVDRHLGDASPAALGADQVDGGAVELDQCGGRGATRGVGAAGERGAREVAQGPE